MVTGGVDSVHDFTAQMRLFVVRIEILLFSVVSLMQPPNPTPLLQPHYEAFFARTGRSARLLRIGTLASRFWPLALLPLHRSDWFLQFRAIACIRVTPSLRRPPPPSHQAPSGFIPEEIFASGFDDT
jgi:hypothetical protein